MTVSPERIEEALAEIAAAIDLGLQAWRTSPPAAQKLRAAFDATQSLAAALREALKQRDRAAFLAEHLFLMVPEKVWRDHGAEWQGQYEGDHHAAQVQQEIVALRALAVSPPADEAKPLRGGT